MVKKLISRSQEILGRQNTGILSAALIIGLSFLGSALLGLIRNRLLASTFFGGLEGQLDVYFAAFVVPDTMFQLLTVGAISASFIPLYQEKLDQSPERSNSFSSTALFLIFLFITLASIIISLFAVPLSNFLTHFSPDRIAVMASLIRIISLAQILFSVSSVLTGILQAQRLFLVPALAPILYNLGTIFGVLFLSPLFGIYGVAFGVVLGALLHVGIQIPFAYKSGFKFSWHSFDLNSGVKEMFRLMPARSLSLSLDQVQRWVAVNLTSMLTLGSLSIYTFARQLYTLPISLFGISLSQASFPSFSETALKSDKADFRLVLAKSISQIFFFALPASVLVLILRIPLVRIAFGARSFPWEATLDTGWALALLSLSIAPQSVIHSLTRALYSLKDTKTPLKIGIISTVIFSLLSFIFTRQLGYGIAGICISTTIANLVDFVLLYRAIVRRVGSLSIVRKLLKVFSVGVLTAFSLWIPMRLLDKFVFDTTRTLPLVVLTLIVSLVGFTVYYSLCTYFEVEEVDDVNHIFKKLGNWRKILASSDEVIDTTTSNI